MSRCARASCASWRSWPTSRCPAIPGVPTLKEAGYDVKPTPQIRAVVAPPGVPNEVVAYWEDRFAKLRATPSWKKYVEDNQLEDHFTNSANFQDDQADRGRAAHAVSGGGHQGRALSGDRVAQPTTRVRF